MFALHLILCCLYCAQSKRNPIFPDDFVFSARGKPRGYYCKQVSDKAYKYWKDNYFCWKKETFNPQITFSHSDTSKKRCELITEPKKNKKKPFMDRYICVPHSSPLHFSWTYSGDLRGRRCIRWKEGRSEWVDNYLCISDDKSLDNLPEAVFPKDFVWSSSGIPDGYNCERTNEPKDHRTWKDNFLCWDSSRKHPGIKWSYDGKIKGMRCTAIKEPKERRGGWRDNYLCVPRSSALRFVWTWKGKRGLKKYKNLKKDCIRWHEKADRGGWGDNYLCLK